MKPRKAGKNERRRGSIMVEFALVFWLLTIILLGVVVVGLNLSRSIKTSQVCRDTGSMFVRGIDFSKDGNKDIVVRLARSMGLARASGAGVVILTKVTWIPLSKCTALSLSPCNANQHVMTQRVVIGDSSLRVSNLGTPAATIIDTNGLVNNYMTEATAVATFPYMQLNEGEFAFVVEAYFPSPDYDLPGFQTGTGAYARVIF